MVHRLGFDAEFGEAGEQILAGSGHAAEARKLRSISGRLTRTDAGRNR
jgi:hypothetical protein